MLLDYYASSVESGNHSTASQQRRWFTLSCRRALTTATPCSPSPQKPPYRQAATGAQRRGSCHHRNTKVRPRTDWHSPQRTSLAQRAAAGQVQARHHDVSLPASSQFRGTVPVRLLHAGRECRRRSYSQLHRQTSSIVVVPCYNRSTYGRCPFSVAGPMTWNSLTDSLSQTHRCPLTVFVRVSFLFDN